jgi:hypothetical protein
MGAQLLLPQFRRDQWAIVQHPAKVKVISAGRRWGKTVTGGNIVLPASLMGNRCMWGVPAYKNGRALWRWATAAVADLRAAKVCDVSQTEHIISFPRSGGFLGLYSLDNPDCVRGEAFDIAVLDEAGSMRPEAWTEAVQPTLADTDGDAFLIGTPKARNWFYEEWLRGQSDGKLQKSWKAPSRDNPNPNIQRAAELARTRVPERVYLQEWEAEFVEDTGAVFRRVREAATAPFPVEPYPGQFVMAIDWGRSVYFTVLIVIDCMRRTVVDFDRFNQVGWEIQRGRVVAMARKWQVSSILAEQNSIGDPNIEQLAGAPDFLPIRGFTTTNATKAEIIEDLVLAIETGDIAFPNIPVLVNELIAFSMEKTKSGLIRYCAPEGLWDDCVIALALARAASKAGVTGSAASAPPVILQQIQQGLRLNLPERGNFYNGLR